MHRVEYVSVQNGRPLNEDMVRFWDIARLGQVVALTDGFSKNKDSKEADGIHVAKTVLSHLYRHLFSLHPAVFQWNLEVYLRRIFDMLNSNTQFYSSGATLALALEIKLPQGQTALALAALGDSVVALKDQNGLTVVPDNHLGLGGQRLWGCFGDKDNRANYENEPEIKVIYPQDDAGILLGSNGLVPVSQSWPQEEGARFIRQQIEHYFYCLSINSMDVTGLAKFAIHNIGSEDNVTVLTADL